MSYVKINEKDVPDKVRFDIPPRNQGQIVLIAYGGYSRAEHGYGDPYKRVVDQSEPYTSDDRVTYYRWVDDEASE